MSTKSLLHQARLNEWLKHFADHKASELSVTDWCLQNNISKYKFFYWNRLSFLQLTPLVLLVQLAQVAQLLHLTPVPGFTSTV